MTSQVKPINSLGTNSAHLRAVRLKSTNKLIFRALLSLSSAALLTRMFGLLNQVVASSHFGAGAAMDAYFVVYTLPTVLALLLIGGIEAAIVPVYAHARAQGSKERASRIFSTVLNLFLLITIVLTALLIIFRRQTISLTAPALDPFRAGLAADLAPFMYPVLVLMVVAGLLECIFNVEGQFGWPAYAGLLVPLTTAILVIIMGKAQGVVVLCVGMVLGLCLQLGIYLIRGKRAKLVYRPVLDLRMPEIGLVFVALWPALLGGLIGEASPLVDQAFASLLSAGSISALSYALKIVSIFSGVIFTSVGRAAFPYLSHQVANNDMKAFKTTLRLYLWAIGLGTAVLSVFMLLLAHPIVQILFQRGAFSAEDTNRTATTLIGFAFGLTPMALGFIGARAFSALGKTKVLMWVSAFSVIANAVFDYIFARFWQSEGIALSTSAVYFCTLFILFITLRRSIGDLHLLTPPNELFMLVNKIKSPLMQFYSRMGKKIAQAGIALAVFVIGIVGSRLNSAYTLRLALGSSLIVFLLRYPYALVVTWVLASVFVSDNIPILTNNNILTGLTVPTLLLITFYLPVNTLLKRMPMLLFLLIYLAWVLAGIGLATSTGSFLTTWLTDLDYLAVALLTIHALTTQKRLQYLIDGLILGGTCVSLLGLYGYITKQNGVTDPTTSLFRIFATFAAAPPLALFLSIVIPLALSRAFTSRGWMQAGTLLSVLILLTAALLTFARGAFISIPLSIVILILFLPSRKIKIALVTCIAGLAIGTLIVIWVGDLPIFSRFLNQDVTTLNGRTLLWQALLDHFDPKQLLGYGLGASNELLTRLQVRLNGDLISTAPSNLFLTTLYDHGIIGLGLLLVMLIAVFIGIIKGILRTKGNQRLLFAVALAVLINVVLQLFEVDDFWEHAIGIYFWIIMALPFSRCWDTIERAPNEGNDIADRVTDIEIEPIFS
ncbi:MAG TPA: murein biosynthesis integral membrane protein MurJ [Ktedonobacteraceae bacterium]